MIKINLSELRKYKVIYLYSESREFIYNEDGTDYKDIYSEPYHVRGFIDNIYVENSKIKIKLYGIASICYSFDDKFEDMEIEIDISKIINFNKLIESKHSRYDSLDVFSNIKITENSNDFYEVIEIDTEDEYDMYEFDIKNCCYTDKKIMTGRPIENIKLYKDTGVDFVIDKLSDYIDYYEMDDFKNKLLTDEKIIKILSIE